MKYMLLSLAALSLVSCGKQEEPATPATSPSASTAPAPSGPLTEAQVGTKFYPGSRVVTSGETPEIISANLETSDPAAKVVEFYEAELGTKASGSTIKTVKDGRTYVVSIAPAGAGTAISIMVKK